MARKVLVLAGMAAQQLLVRGSEVKKGPVTSRHLQITTTGVTTTAGPATATEPAATSPAAFATLHMSLTQVIGILVGGGMLLIGFCLVAYIVVLNKRLRQEAKDRYHDEEEGQLPVRKSASRVPAASAAGGSPTRRPSFDKSLAMRELAAKDAELRGPEHERAVRQLQRFPVSPVPVSSKPVASPAPAQTPQSEPQQHSPPRSAHSAFPGIPLKTPPQQQAQQQQRQRQQAPVSAPAPASVPARTPAAAPVPVQPQASLRTPGTASPPPSKYVELSDVFGED